MKMNWENLFYTCILDNFHCSFDGIFFLRYKVGLLLLKLIPLNFHCVLALHCISVLYQCLECYANAVYIASRWQYCCCKCLWKNLLHKCLINSLETVK